MTKENKFKIAMALNGVALLLDDETFNKIKNRLQTIEEIVAREPDTEETVKIEENNI